MSYLDLGSSEHLDDYAKYATRCGNGVTSMRTVNEEEEDDEPSAIHLLPNILIGTGKYCRSCKYHDKAVDTAHLTDNGYLITASAGNTLIESTKLYFARKYLICFFVNIRNLYIIFRI